MGRPDQIFLFVWVSPCCPFSWPLHCPRGLTFSDSGSGKAGYLRRPYRVPPQLSQVSSALDLFTALAAAVEK